MSFNRDSEELDYARIMRKRVLKEQVVYHSELAGKIRVPIGFDTDFASVPQFIRVYVSNEDWRIVRPAIVHDYTYRKKIFKRKKCDRIFYEALRCEGVGWWKSNLMYLGVRCFGGSHYPKR